MPENAELSITQHYLLGQVGLNTMDVLESPRWFSVSPTTTGTFGSLLGHEDVLLKFSVKKPLRLLRVSQDFPESPHSFMKRLYTDDSLDGYVSVGESLEMFLKHPGDCLESEATEVNLATIRESSRAEDEAALRCV